MKKALFWDKKIVPPLENSVTLCVIGNDIIHIRSNEDKQIEQYRKVRGIIYPDVALPSAHDPVMQKAFKPEGMLESFLKLLPVSIAKFKSQEVFKERLVNSKERLVNSKERLVNSKEHLVNSKEHLVNSKEHLVNSKEHLVNSKERLVNSKEHPVKCISWHYYCPVIAIMHQQDRLFLYDLVSELYYTSPPNGITSIFQEGATCVAFRPCSSTLLAVGSKTGVIIWRFKTSVGESSVPLSQPVLPFISKNSEHPTIWAQRSLKNVSAIAWSPNGQYLVIGALYSYRLTIWDVSYNKCVSHSRIGFGTKALQFSLNGRYLLQSCRGKILRVWDTCDWSDVTIKTQSEVESINFFPDSRTIVFSQEDSNTIYFRQVRRQNNILENVSAIDYTTENYGFGMPSGGIKSISITPSGKHMLLSFSSRNPGRELISVLKVCCDPIPLLKHIGFIRGPGWHPNDPSMTSDPLMDPPMGNPGPVEIKFAPRDSSDSLAAISWENGKVTFLNFLSEKS